MAARPNLRELQREMKKKLDQAEIKRWLDKCPNGGAALLITADNLLRVVMPNLPDEEEIPSDHPCYRITLAMMILHESNEDLAQILSARISKAQYQNKDLN